jgi:hypothetical protein
MGWTYDDYNDAPGWWLRRGELFEEVLAAEADRRRQEREG